MSTREATFTVAADHPGLPGHFPGNPVVPGVVLLDHVLEQVRASAPGWRIDGVPRVKFTRPVRPEQPVAVVVQVDADRATARFRCRVAGETVAEGRVTLVGAGADSGSAP